LREITDMHTDNPEMALLLRDTYGIVKEVEDDPEQIGRIDEGRQTRASGNLDLETLWDSNLSPTLISCTIPKTRGRISYSRTRHLTMNSC
jgi:hypothetical protein